MVQLRLFAKLQFINSHRAEVGKGRWQISQLLQGNMFANTFVTIDDFAAHWIGDWHNRSEVAFAPGAGCPLLTIVGNLIDLLTTDAVIGGNQICTAAHQ